MDAALVLFEELDWRMLHYVLLGLQMWGLGLQGMEDEGGVKDLLICENMVKFVKLTKNCEI